MVYNCVRFLCRLATELPDPELRRTLWVSTSTINLLYNNNNYYCNNYAHAQSLVAFPKIKRQVLICEPQVKNPKEFTEGSLFSINQEFGLV